MAEFEGYLLKFTKTGTIFPTKYIVAETFKSTPLQRTELKAYRDNLNMLHRTTSPNHKTKLTFTTKSLNLNELREIQTILRKAYSQYNQRKLSVEYWDDEILGYRTMIAYIPDINYTIKTITNNTIKYAGIELTFIEY